MRFSDLGVLLLAAHCVVPAAADPVEIAWQDERAVSRLFSEAGIEGTFVSCRQPDGVMTGYNPERALERLPPASTFKIPHTLIALQSGAVSGPDEAFEWDGKPRAFRSWERDMTLAEAMQASNVPVYRGVASRIGRDRMQTHLESFDYGSRQVGESLSDFWLVGPLEISAAEQCRFLLRLATGRLPVDPEHLQTLRAMLATDAGDGVTVYAKTGWTTAPDPGRGWWAGWVEGSFGTAAYAIEIDMTDAGQAPLREQLGREALRLLGLLPR